MTKKGILRLIIWFVMVIVLILFVGGPVTRLFPPFAPKWALPSSAANVQQFYLRDFDGYTHYIKAALPKADFPIYAKNLGLTRRFNPSEWPETAIWPFDPRPVSYKRSTAWFDPPEKDIHIEWYWRKDINSGLAICLAWHNGFVYYNAYKD